MRVAFYLQEKEGIYSFLNLTSEASERQDGFSKVTQLDLNHCSDLKVGAIPIQP